MTPSTATTEELIQQMDNPRFWGMGHLDPAWYNRKRELMNSRLGISIIFFKLTVDGVDYVMDHLGRRHTGARPGDAMLNCVLLLCREAGIKPGESGLTTAYQGTPLGVRKYALAAKSSPKKTEASFHSARI